MKYTYQFYNENVERTNTTYLDELNVKTNTSSFINLFPIMLDKDNNEKFINIFRSYKTNDENNELDKKMLMASEPYECDEIEWFENISAKYYYTPFYWWVICMLNNIQNPFEDTEPGKLINIMPMSLLYQLSKELEKIASLK